MCHRIIGRPTERNRTNTRKIHTEVLVHDSAECIWNWWAVFLLFEFLVLRLEFWLFGVFCPRLFCVYKRECRLEFGCADLVIARGCQKKRHAHISTWVHTQRVNIWNIGATTIWNVLCIRVVRCWIFELNSEQARPSHDLRTNTPNQHHNREMTCDSEIICS